MAVEAWGGKLGVVFLRWWRTKFFCGSTCTLREWAEIGGTEVTSCPQDGGGQNFSVVIFIFSPRPGNAIIAKSVVMPIIARTSLLKIVGREAPQEVENFRLVATWLYECLCRRTKAPRYFETADYYRARSLNVSKLMGDLRPCGCARRVPYLLEIQRRFPGSRFTPSGQVWSLQPDSSPYSSCTLTEQSASLPNEQTEPLQNQSKTFECDWCGWELSEAPAFKCPGCTDKYCSQGCLDKSADFHVRRCANPRRPLTTADTLITAAFADMFFDDPQTNEDYFFTRVRTPHDKTMLFGLYVGILKYQNVEPSTLHEWRISGTMVENIKALYEYTYSGSTQALPANNRGGYYPWFLKHLDIFEPRPDALVPLSVPPRHLCASCGVSAGVRCSACKKVWYCSKKCQQDEWSGHIVDCYRAVGRPITSADHLRAAVHRQKLPENLEILSDYGFTRVDEGGRKMLLEVYRVVFEEGVRSRALLQWQAAGNLLREVEMLLDRLEIWKTYPTMSWFRAHRHAFDPTMRIPENNNSDLARIKAAAVGSWEHVGDFPSQNADEIFSAVTDSWSRERATVFRFLSILGVCHPGPDLDGWVQFGFCACHDESEEQFLSATYKILAQCCSFDAFVTAYSTSKLVELFDAYQLRGRRIIHPYLEDVLSGSPVVFKSVWNLKQHVMDPQSTRSHVIPSVEVDYGFVNCTSESEYKDLKDLYKSFFVRRDANPLKLHEACVSGTLYAHVLGLFPELAKKKNRTKKFGRLLRNLYPLAR
ncbi:hypothetical protein DFH07DRAFT_937338 [Mycena maculata]|uniref:MYND-type domain-containing protein n=1 Tax=Mycena maculata TaxID=230809 RepID=A0AAD7K165_9AGAR|nr:hypothetical protein DFH07DRAFT_937338 [Mycena maculata]